MVFPQLFDMDLNLGYTSQAEFHGTLQIEGNLRVAGQ
jgi:hypothetical protein